MTRQIKTENIYPPIPIRTMDWVAYFDGDEESGPRGWGRTEEEAIRDLKENYDEEPKTPETAWQRLFAYLGLGGFG